MNVAQDFADETAALYALLTTLPEKDFDHATLFKGWTINDVVRHLHFWNRAAALSLRDEPAFLAYMQDMMPGLLKNGIRKMEDAALDDLAGKALLSSWINTSVEMAALFGEADPKARVKWVGPDMSVQSSVTARLMETWAHGQAIYDLLGIERVDKDRIRHICHLGSRTFGWAFQINGKKVPETRPFVALTGPSGDLWQWHEPSSHEVIKGSATEFCQVVTQTRNIADTSLQVIGPVATEWMDIAQCFAGAAHAPPAPGMRRKKGVDC